VQRRIIGLGVLLALAASPLLAAGKLFDGEEKTFVFVGYSTSYRWPNILEHKINRQFENAIVYQVMNAASGGAPVGTWVAAEESVDWQRSYGRMLRDWFLPLDSRPNMEGRMRFGNIPKPTVALLQQSLQRTCPIIQGPDDRENIVKCADEMQKLVEALHRDGVELIFFATHIYKYTHEPQVEHEKYALDELLKRDLPYVWPGPELWRASKARWPEIFTQPDQVHLNELGDTLDASAWYELLMRYDRGELERSLESAWGEDWRESIYLKGKSTQQ